MRIAVVGRGLIGSAAARHLSGNGHEIALVGPDEPADFSSHKGVFGSHYDEGRITRSLDPSLFWSEVGRASIERYREIEAASGISFFGNVGALLVGPAGNASIGSISRLAAEEHVTVEALDHAALRAKFPYFRFPDAANGYFEPENAGYVSPRRLVQAQTLAAERSGATIVRSAVQAISENRSGVILKTDRGEVTAEQVLVAAGGHSEAVLGQSLGLTVHARTIARFALRPDEVERLADMPSLIWYGPIEDSFYYLPPIPYPDGQTWIKLGGDPVDIELGSDGDIRDWYRSGGSPEVADHLESAIFDRIPGLKTQDRRIAPCMTTYTHNDLPKIGPISDRVFVAIAGCGKGAKSSDELGRLGAAAVLGEVRPDLAP